ncbi:MAG TPA: efflux RND transporter periplasmic adaptor subunit [Wenzhouxiangellaceae bacterium]|nr:efflux RND transporter periplasmic adaptor subunit [Wenzhouxiangellaceae bacterium]
MPSYRFRLFRSLGLALLAVSTLVVLTGCGTDANSSDTPESADAPVSVPVEVARVAFGDVSSAYTGTATLVPERQTPAVAKLGGIALEILVEEGDRVEAGQVMARLERDRYEFQAQQTEARLLKLENELKRARELHDRELISTDEYERVRFDTDAQRAANGLAQLDLAHTEIRAPIAGVVAERMVKVGNLVAQNQPLFMIDDFDPLWAVLHVPERELNLLDAGQKATLQVDAFPGQEFTGEVLRISPVVDAETGTFKVTATFSDASGRLRPGLFGRVQVVHDSRQNVPLVPQTALLSEDGEVAVFVARQRADGAGYTAERRTVRTGYSGAAGVEIVEGLGEGDTVVTAGKNSLRDGAELRVIDAGIIES